MGRALENMRAERDAAWERAPRYDERPWNEEQQAAHDAWVDAEIRAARKHLRAAPEPSAQQYATEAEQWIARGREYNDRRIVELQAQDELTAGDRQELQSRLGRQRWDRGAHNYGQRRSK